MIQAVVFDMDGLMFDTERLCEEAFRCAGNQFGIEVRHEFFVRLLGLAVPEVDRCFLEEFGTGFPLAHFRRASSQYREAYIEERGLPEKPGLRPLLSYLSENRYGIAVASSTSAALVRSHLRRVGLDQLFGAVIGGDMVEHSKPAPDIYRRACEQLGVDPALCMALEDSYHGIRSAYSAGLKAVMVPDLLQPTEEISAMLFAKVDRLEQVIGLLEERKRYG